MTRRAEDGDILNQESRAAAASLSLLRRKNWMVKRLAEQHAASAADSLRLFVACELPESWRDGLDRAQRDWRAALGEASRQVRWVEPAVFHLTLLFLGATPRDDAPAIEAALRRTVAGLRPFELRAGALGTFGGQRPRVLWAGLDGDMDSLARLQRKVEEGLPGLGERGHFSPHITLGRARDGAGTQAVTPVLHAPPPALVVPPLRVDAIALIESELRPGGPVHRRRLLATFGKD